MAQSMPNDYDALAKRLRSKVYSSTEELKKDFLDGLAAIARQPSVDRGLARKVVADVQGGTTLGVGDPNAGNISEYLVQNPQPGIPKDVGSGLETRRQTRVETRTRVLPAVVVEAASSGDPTVRVKVVAEGVGKAVDATTGIEVVGDITSPLGEAVADVEGVEYLAKMTGQPIVNAGDTGIQPIEAGRTVEVAVSENWEVTTTHTKRGRKSLPVVVRVQKETTACLCNGFATLTEGEACVPTVIAFHRVDSAADFVWDLTPYQGPGIAPPNTRWRIVTTRNVAPYIYDPWWGRGCIDGTGTLVGLPASVDFTGILVPFSQTAYLVKGCPLGDPVTEIRWPFVGASDPQPITPAYPC